MKYLLLIIMAIFTNCSKNDGISCPPGREYECGCYPTPGATREYEPAFKNGGGCFYTDQNGTNQKIDGKYCLCL